MHLVFVARLTNVDQNMQCSPQCYRLLYSSFAGLFAGDVSLDNLRDATLLVDHPLGLFGPIDIGIDKRNFGAVSSKKNSSRTSITNLTCRLVLGQHCSDARKEKRKNLSPSIREPAPVTRATSFVRSNALDGCILNSLSHGPGGV